MPASADVYLFGGGEDAPQSLAYAELAAARRPAAAPVDGGAVRARGVRRLPAARPPLPHDRRATICPASGCSTSTTVPGEGVPPCGRRDRRRARPALGLPTLTGFENHGGRTHLGAGVAAPRPGADAASATPGRRHARAPTPAGSSARTCTARCCAQPGARRSAAVVGGRPARSAPRAGSRGPAGRAAAPLSPPRTDGGRRCGRAMGSLSFDPIAARYDATRGGEPAGPIRGRRAATVAADRRRDLRDRRRHRPRGDGGGRAGAPTVVGIDISPAMLAVAAARFGGPLLRADATALPFAAGSLAAIYAVWVFHLVDDPAAVLASCYRVLRPGGRVLAIISDESRRITHPRGGARSALPAPGRHPRAPRSARHRRRAAPDAGRAAARRSAARRPRPSWPITWSTARGRGSGRCPTTSGPPRSSP